MVHRFLHKHATNLYTKFYEELERSLTSYKIDRTLDVRCYGTVYIRMYVDVTRLLVGARGWRARLIWGNPFVAVSTPTWSRLGLIQVGESMILKLSLLRD